MTFDEDNVPSGEIDPDDPDNEGMWCVHCVCGKIIQALTGLKQIRLGND